MSYEPTLKFYSLGSSKKRIVIYAIANRDINSITAEWLEIIIPNDNVTLQTSMDGMEAHVERASHVPQARYDLGECQRLSSLHDGEYVRKRFRVLYIRSYCLALHGVVFLYMKVQFLLCN